MSARPRLRAVTPLLVVSDLQRSIEFYRDKLGFGDANAWGDPPCFALLNRDGFDLMLSLAESEAGVARRAPSEVWDVYLSVADVAAEQAALDALGLRPDKGPTDTFYSMREIEILDPDGHRLCIAQEIGSEAPRGAEVWEGELDLGSAKLRLVLKLVRAAEGLTARLDSPDQGALNLPVDALARTATGLEFEMRAIQASYQGTLRAEGTELEGTWSQRGRSWPLVLRKTR